MTKRRMSDVELLITIVTRAEDLADELEAMGRHWLAAQLREAARVGEDALIEIGAVSIKLPVGQE